ncbi:uncharacterized protein LOC143600735 [Bidens hawaiensis]|uniref:uncharacterized protein LOC143600735 n=1 Tax=Bidens hawaiensis TaxID=980011 RepID=UPI0040490C13
MGDGPRGVEIFPDHFQASTSGMETPPQTTSPSMSSTRTEEHGSSSRLWARRRFRSAATVLNLLSPRKLSWVKDTSGKEKVVLSSMEVKSLQAEVADLEEREYHLRAKLEHIDEILHSCLLSGYLYMRTRWETLPGEPLPLDDTEVDDWVLCFVVLHGPCIYLYYVCTDLSPQDSTLLSDITEVGPLPHVIQEDGETRYYFYIVTRFGLRYECSSTSKIQVDSWLAALQDKCKLSSHSICIKSVPFFLCISVLQLVKNTFCLLFVLARASTNPQCYTAMDERMSSQIFRSASRAARSIVSSASKHKRLFSEGRSVAAATAVSSKGFLPALGFFGRDHSGNTSSKWIAGAFALPAAAYMLQDQEAHAAELERTFIAIKPDGVQRGLISEIVARFERKGFKLVTPTKSFAQKHYHDLKERPFFDGHCDFLSSGPVLAMVWEGEGVIKYGRKLIGATDPQKSEPGTIRGDLAVVVGRYKQIHKLFAHL